MVNIWYVIGSLVLILGLLRWIVYLFAEVRRLRSLVREGEEIPQDGIPRFARVVEGSTQRVWAYAWWKGQEVKSGSIHIFYDAPRIDCEAINKAMERMEGQVKDGVENLKLTK